MTNLFKYKPENILDILIIFILGITLISYSIFYKAFAEVHITLPFLNFPIFIGEIILSSCIVLMIGKWILIKKRFSKIYILLVAYIMFFLAKAWFGYKSFGPLALRHAAMFYYPLFGLIAYETYQNKFLRPGPLSSIFILVLLFSMFALTGIATYYNFSYLILALIFILSARSIWLKTIGVIILLFFFPFKLLLQCCRTQFMGHIIGFITLGLSTLLMVKIRKKYKVIILSIALCFGAIALKDNSRIILLLDFKGFLSSMKSWDELITIRKQNYKLFDFRKRNYGKQDIRLYNPEKKDELPILKIMSKKQISSINENPIIKITPSVENTKVTKNSERNKLEIEKVEASVELPLENKKDSSEIKKTENFVKELQKENPQEEKTKIDWTQRHNTALFRLFAWRDMIKELIKERKILGFHFGKPLRSESLELTEMAIDALREDGWISAHNSYLEIIYRSGLVGIILFISLFITLFKMARQFLLLGSFYGMFLVSIISYWLVTAMFYVTLEMPYSAIFFWTIFGITLAYCRKTLNCKI